MLTGMGAADNFAGKVSRDGGCEKGFSHQRSSIDAAQRRGHLLTEQRHQRAAELDAMSPEAAFDLMNGEDASVPAAVAAARPAILATIEKVVTAWKNGGRLIYVGAGTSGRLGVLDAAECPPTFCSDPGMVVGLIAGGRDALVRSIEGAEDDPTAGAKDVADLEVTRRDVVMGIATGGTTPYVHGALAEARRRGATAVFFACVPAEQVKADCDIDIRVLTGPEIITGSTRLKAGTATKLTLNMITTLSMVRIGKTYGNLMVDLSSFVNRKLIDRATRLVSEIAGVEYERAGEWLQAAGGRAKTAIVMARLGVDRAAAEARLADCGGHLREALGIHRRGAEDAENTIA